MKNRILKTLAALILAASSGVAIHNYTGTDISLPDGSVITSDQLTENLTKTYKSRKTSNNLYITIHHTAGSEKATLESIAKFHVEKRGWPAIAYHIAINQDGDIHFLNDIEQLTYHDSGENTTSIGVVLVGNFEEIEPSDKMMASVKLVVDALCQTLNITHIRGHKDTSPTLCPGKYAYNDLQEIF